MLNYEVTEGGVNLLFITFFLFSSFFILFHLFNLFFILILFFSTSSVHFIHFNGSIGPLAHRPVIESTSKAQHYSLSFLYTCVHMLIAHTIHILYLYFAFFHREHANEYTLS